MENVKQTDNTERRIAAAVLRAYESLTPHPVTVEVHVQTAEGEIVETFEWEEIT